MTFVFYKYNHLCCCCCNTADAGDAEADNDPLAANMQVPVDETAEP